MLTNFGKFCRKLRIENGELLFDMANKLGVSSAFLSKVENGKRKPPKEWKDKIISLYCLGSHKEAELDQCMYEAMNYNSLDLSDFSDNSRFMLLSFARKLNSMDETEKDRFMKMIENNGGVAD